jgi:S-adenosylmethionine-dependent methyltransferase
MTGVEGYYDQEAQAEWERLERHKIEMAVTLRVLDEYLPRAPASIVDIGGGPGRYAIALAAQGYAVTLVELSEQLLGLAREKAGQSGVRLADYMRAGVLDLAELRPESFDAVLLLGPLSHLLRPSERKQAVTEAGALLKTGGLVFAGFITRYAPVRYAAKYDPRWVLEHSQRLEEILTTGMNLARRGSASTDSYFALPSEIRPLMEQAGFEAIDLVACEGVVSMIDEKLNELTGELWEAWVELNYLLGKDPTVHGAAEHLLYVGRKTAPL